ncbi:MAG: hypothetical protein QMD05_11060, partial [Candidatus Brocadiaceae bacterium]|nr:hypothetical protein [Candidatus Brocadiaceae bacterium]
NSKCREMIQQRVLTAFKEELQRSTQPGYKPPRMEEVEDIDYIGDYPEEDKEQRFGEGILP